MANVKCTNNQGGKESCSENEEEYPDSYDMDLRDEVKHVITCPICLRIMRHVVFSKECCHRFCEKCISQNIRSRNYSCPICRGDLFSARCLRRDPGMDAIIKNFVSVHNSKQQREDMLYLPKVTSQHLDLEKFSMKAKHGDRAKLQSFSDENCIIVLPGLHTTSNSTSREIKTLLTPLSVPIDSFIDVGILLDAVIVQFLVVPTQEEWGAPRAKQTELFLKGMRITSQAMVSKLTKVIDVIKGSTLTLTTSRTDEFVEVYIQTNILGERDYSLATAGVEFLPVSLNTTIQNIIDTYGFDSCYRQLINLFLK